MSYARGDGKKKKVCRLKICRRVEDAAPSALLQGLLPAAGHLDRTHCLRTRNVCKHFNRCVVDPKAVCPTTPMQCSPRTSFVIFLPRKTQLCVTIATSLHSWMLSTRKTGWVDRNDRDVKPHCILHKYKVVSRILAVKRVNIWVSGWGGKFRTITCSREWGWEKKRIRWWCCSLEVRLEYKWRSLCEKRLAVFSLNSGKTCFRYRTAGD